MAARPGRDHRVLRPAVRGGGAAALTALDRGYKILGGKTGHTDAAGYCLLISAEIAGRRVVVALLGGKTSQARFDDFARLITWLAAAPPGPGAPGVR